MAVTHVQLGGELSGRSILGGNRNKVEWWGMLTGLVLTAACALATIQWAWTIILWALVFGAVFVVWSPRPSTGHASVMGWVGIRRRWTHHRRSGVLDYPGAVAVQEADDGQPHLPISMGRMRGFEVELWPGREDPGRVHVLRHRQQDETVYTAVFEFRAQRAGVMTQMDGLRNHTGWGELEATLARQGSLVRDVQQVARVVPFDPADHVSWLIDELPDGPPQVLVQSYADLVDDRIATHEQNRTWLVVGIPAAGAFNSAAQRVSLPEGAEELTAAEKFELRESAVLAGELRRVVSRGRSVGMSFRPLSERREAAVFRSLQDPDVPLDKLDGADKYSMWLPWIGSDSRRYLRIQGSERDWYTRTAIVPRDGFASGPIPVDSLVPLLTGVNPPVIRTVTTHASLIPASAARAEAKSDVTTDRGTVSGNAAKVSGGEAEAQMSASQQRLDDLRPGSGIHGASWALAVTIQAASLDELEQATNQIEEAAADSNITSIVWQDSRHHLSLPMTLPLSMGVNHRRKKGLFR